MVANSRAAPGTVQTTIDVSRHPSESDQVSLLIKPSPHHAPLVVVVNVDIAKRLIEDLNYFLKLDRPGANQAKAAFA